MGTQQAILAADLPEEEIRRRSEQIWEREGRPEGYAEDHWRRARAELAALMARTSSAPPAPAISPADDAAPRPLRMPPLQRAPQTAVVPSIICTGMVLRGALESSGDIQFDGIIEGDICCAGLAVGDTAVIQGDVVADKVLVRGRIKGRICARQVYLSAGAFVEGDIHYETLTVEEGVHLNGCFQRLDEPHSSTPVVQDAAIG